MFKIKLIHSGRVELQSYSDESSLGWEIESKKSQTSKKSQSYSVEVQLQFLQAEGYVLKLADVIPGEVESISGRCLALLSNRCGTLTGSRKDEKVSRQEYLKKMEQKKLKELRDDIEDEQYLFDGVKLIESEYGELRGAVAAVVCSLVLVLIKRFGGRKTIGEALQDERINGGAFIGTDGLQFPHKLIPGAS
ncbi:unnamed protein product [Camellia sinensis]